MEVHTCGSRVLSASVLQMKAGPMLKSFICCAVYKRTSLDFDPPPMMVIDTASVKGMAEPTISSSILKVGCTLYAYEKHGIP